MQYLLNEEEYSALVNEQEGVPDYKVLYDKLLNDIIANARSVQHESNISNKGMRVLRVLSVTLPEDAIPSYVLERVTARLR